MSENEKTTDGPQATPPSEDVGADTQRRFRHQACYAALVSLGLLEDDGPLKELYCEHHDDVVLHLKSGLFRAVQIKTRLIGGVPFKAGEDEVVGSLRRFAALEQIFPGHFEAYLLASNVGFWHEKKNTSNLQHMLDAVRAEPLVDGALPFVKKIAAAKPALDLSLLVQTLRKVQLTETPGLDDIEAKLREQLAQTDCFRGRRYDELKDGGGALLQRIFDASSLATISALPEYLSLCSSSPESAKQQHVIESKRITQTVVTEVLNRGLSPTALLRTHQSVPVDELPSGMKRMELKMAAGGLSVSEIDHLKDLKFSAETLLQGWLYKFGQQRAQEYYEHLRVLVRGECLEATQQSRQDVGLYGAAMLKDLRQRLDQISTTRPGDTLQCSRDALLGMAGILTEDCKVWWSSEFDLPGDVL
jgi:hypothetical protein